MTFQRLLPIAGMRYLLPFRLLSRYSVGYHKAFTNTDARILMGADNRAKLAMFPITYCRFADAYKLLGPAPLCPPRRHGRCVCPAVALNGQGRLERQTSS